MTVIMARGNQVLGGEPGAAWLSEDGRYRYLLTRWLDDAPATMTWIMLNPSTADADTDDPTIGRCIRFARREGCGSMRVVNLFAYRATNPRELAACPGPAGPENDRFIDEAATASLVVVAWGAHATAAGRAREVGQRLTAAGVPLLCLGVTKDGHPKHPLARGRERVPDDAPLIPWEAS